MFDTYAADKALRDAGFDRPRAEAAVAMVRDAVSEGVATGEDAARPESKVDTGIAEAKADAARLESNVDARFAEAKAEVAEVKTGVTRLEGKVESENAGIEGRVESGSRGLEAHPTVRMYSGLIATSAVLLALIKLLP